MFTPAISLRARLKYVQLGRPRIAFNIRTTALLTVGLTTALWWPAALGSFSDAAEANDTSYFLSRNFQAELSRAVGMDRSEFEQLLNEKPPTNPVGGEAVTSSLTEYLLGSPGPSKHLHGVMDRALSPKAIVQACRPATDGEAQRATIIQPSYITKLVVVVDGDEATGTVEYHAPKAFAGAVRFGCEKSSGKWRVTSFDLDEWNVRLIRDGRGWKVEKTAASATGDVGDLDEG